MKETIIENILDYPVYGGGKEPCIDSIVSWLTKGDHCRWLACLNPHSYVTALEDRRFARALKAADWLIPDGSGIVLASRILGGNIHQRMTGSDLFDTLNTRMNAIGSFSVFFLGSSPANLGDIEQRMRQDYPHIRFAGSYSPPYKPEYSAEELDAMIAAINQAEPDVLWVGMTAPKQEKWIYQNLSRLNVRFAAAIGAVFDFYTGKVKRSHPFFQRLGLEWLPRLLQEPKRLWQRNFISTPKFFAEVAKQHFKGKRSAPLQ